MNNEKNKLSVKETFKNADEWVLDRRGFVKSVTVAALISQITSITACSFSEVKVYQANKYLTKLQSEIIQKIQSVLFPNDGNGPSVEDINAFKHLVWVLSDLHKDKESKEYIIKGINWAEETAQENYQKSFSELNQNQIEELVAFMANVSWGKSWLSILLTLIFEALALDPIYNVNTNQVGWKWLSHPSGTPRPNKSNSYPTIFKTIHEK